MIDIDFKRVYSNCNNLKSGFSGEYLQLYYRGADIRTRSSCSTFQPSNLTYHERTTFIDIY